MVLLFGGAAGANIATLSLTNLLLVFFFEHCVHLARHATLLLRGLEHRTAQELPLLFLDHRLLGLLLHGG